MHRMFVAALFGAAGVLSQAAAATACSPMPQRFISPFERIHEADHVYVGRVSLASKTDLEANYNVQVVKSFKGDAGNTLRFKSHTVSSACGFILRDGYYIFYQPSRLVKAQTPQLLSANSRLERYDTAEDALAATTQYFAVMSAANTAPPMEIRSETDATGKTVARLHAPQALRARITAALADTNGCMKTFGARFPGSYFDIKLGIAIDWGERPNHQARGEPSCDDPLQHVYEKPGTYTVHVSTFTPPSNFTISPGDWTTTLKAAIRAN